jgi:gentisate 1,2-dioxygenase
VIWVDVLNVPLVESLNATQFEFEPTMRKLGLFREEGRTAAGAIELLAA